MMTEWLRSDLELADPLAGSEQAVLDASVRRMTAEAREAATADAPGRKPWWRRRRTMIPLGIASVVALTGAALVVPLSMGINDTWVDPDTEIPIIYTTDTGVDVRCRYGIYFGDPVNRTAADEQLAEFVQKHDWTGIGQRIYDEAVANPFVPGPDDDWEVDNQETRDSFSFFRAVDLIWAEIPAELQQEGQFAGGSSDCTGRLR